MNFPISKLTDEQESLISFYREKWKNKTISIEKIDRNRARNAIKKLYKIMDMDSPTVLFYESIPTMLQVAVYASKNQKPLRLQNLGISLMESFPHYFEKKLGRELLKNFNYLDDLKFIYGELTQYVACYETEKIDVSFPFKYRIIKPEERGRILGLLDFCIAVFNYPYNRYQWDIFGELICSCGWIVPFEHDCLVCDRPIEINFDYQENQFVRKPLMKFSDGFEIYPCPEDEDEKS
jgi:hypothetical protein